MEDLPDSPEEPEAEELLAAFACLAHPSAVTRINRPPSWDRADMPPSVHPGDVVLVPSGCQSWIEPTWIAEVQADGVSVIEGCQSLEDWFSAIADAYGDSPWPDDVRDAFASVGLTRLFVERLARRMHDFDGIDESRLFDSLRQAATTLATDTSTALVENSDGEQGEALDNEPASEPPDLDLLIAPCFDPLLEYRERLHPLDSYLLDVVMLADGDANSLTEALKQFTPTQSQSNEHLNDEHENDQQAATTRQHQHVSLDAAPMNFMADQPCWESLIAERPEIQETIRELWPQRHCDLLIGESESCETRLEPSTVTADRLAEVRQWTKHTFGLPPRVWARREYGFHPDLPALLKSAGYEGALHLTFDVGPYPDQEDAKLTWQAPDRTGIEAFSRLPVPAARAATFWQFADRLGESVEFDTASALMFVRWADTDPWWYRLFRNAMRRSPVLGRFATVGEFLSEAEGHGAVLRANAREYGSAALAKRAALKSADPLSTEAARWNNYVQSIGESVCRGIASIVRQRDVEGPGSEALARSIASAEAATGTLVLNPMPTTRWAVVSNDAGPVVVEVPPYGYTWVADDAQPTAGLPLAEDLSLRNEFFELQISENSGGLKRLMQYGRRGNFLSQHVARRFANSDDAYLKAVASETTIIENTGAAATIESRGQILSEEGEPVADVVQQTRVVRGQPWFDITVTIDGSPQEDGNPWIDYDAVRFAWSTEFSAVSQSCGIVPTPAAADRMESPLFVEIDDNPVITIMTHGLTFHRREGRKLDAITSVVNESSRTFRFSVAVGQRDPGGVALAAMLDGESLMFRSAPPSTPTAWLVSFDRAGVVLLNANFELDPDGQPTYRLRIREIIGASGVVTIRLCRPAAEALARDLAGRLTDRLTIRDGAIEARLREYQMRDIIVRLA